MDTILHNVNNLFAQLGLATEESEIQAFIEAHRPLESRIALSQAPFWTVSQARFLREQIANDADWAQVVDKLDVSLRE